jgi:nicotinate dehydrogenase subunit A
VKNKFAMQFQLNGQACTPDLPAEYPLLLALRSTLGLHSPRWGCGLEQCGACHVVIDGQSVPSCTRTLADVNGRAVHTPECGAQPNDAPFPDIFAALQDAFLAEEAAQCGYCTSGILVSAAALLHRQPQPNDAQVREALDPHLCRCGAHQRVLRAVHRAATALQAREAS